jgi:mono/diheme cytochrome c family protein
MKALDRLILLPVALLLAAGVPLIASACGGGGSASSLSGSPGATIFHDHGCYQCHTLSIAKATGQVGPNLDLLKPDAVTVAHQVRVGGNGMPSFQSQLSNKQIQQVAQFVAAASHAAGKVPAFKRDKTTLADCAKKTGGFACYRQAFGNLVFEDGPTKALATLATDSTTLPAVRADCHQIVHSIGHAALAYYHDNAGEALAHGQMTCNSGYYHGVIELSISGKPRSQIVPIVRKLCTNPSVTKNTFLLYQCVHGLGHGLMIYSGDDLPYSLHVCDQLTTSFAREACPGGVFMQNLDTGMISSRYIRAKDPIYPCTIVAKRHKYYCYLQATERILQVVGYKWPKVAAWCRKSEPGWADICFQSMGRDASGFSQYHPEKALAICAQAGDKAGECIFGAARDYANNFAGGREAAQLCNLAPERYRGRCYEGIGTILGALHTYEQQRRAACAAVTPPRHRRDCLRGAAVI